MVGSSLEFYNWEGAPTPRRNSIDTFVGLFAPCRIRVTITGIWRSGPNRRAAIDFQIFWLSVLKRRVSTEHAITD